MSLKKYSFLKTSCPELFRLNSQEDIKPLDSLIQLHLAPTAELSDLQGLVQQQGAPQGRDSSKGSFELQPVQPFHVWNILEPFSVKSFLSVSVMLFFKLKLFSPQNINKFIGSLPLGMYSCIQHSYQMLSVPSLLNASHRSHQPLSNSAAGHRINFSGTGARCGDSAGGFNSNKGPGSCNRRLVVESLKHRLVVESLKHQRCHVWRIHDGDISGICWRTLILRIY